MDNTCFHLYRGIIVLDVRGGVSMGAGQEDGSAIGKVAAGATQIRRQRLPLSISPAIQQFYAPTLVDVSFCG